MRQSVRVIILNMDEAVATDLKSVLLSIDGVSVVAELEEPALLGQVLDQNPAEVLVAHLDPNAAEIMEIIAPIIEARKEKIASIGMTENRDAEIVMRAMRAGMREFLWKPFPPEQLGEILLRIAGDGSAGSRKVGRLISVVGTCGGVGATMLATNMAVELLDDGTGKIASSTQPIERAGAFRVAVVDLDTRMGQVALQLDAQVTYTLADLCENPEAIDKNIIDRAMWKHPCGVHVLSRPTDFSQAERLHPAQIAAVLSALQEHYDYIFVDLSTRFDATAHTVFDRCDTNFIVSQMLVPSIRNTVRMLRELSQRGYPMDRVKLIANRVGRESGLLEVDEVETTLKRKFDNQLPDEWKTCATSVNMGVPLAAHAPKSKLRNAVRSIALSLCGRGQAAPSAADSKAASGAKRSVFSFLSGARAATS